jgi:cyanophycin synthetase
MDRSADRAPDAAGALREAARQRDVAFLQDEAIVSVGLGAGALVWPATEVPAPERVDWSVVHDVPVVLVAGADEPATTLGLIARMVAEDDKVPGWATGRVSRVGHEFLDVPEGDASAAARRILRDPRTQVALLATGPAGVARGAVVHRVHAAAVLGVAEDGHVESAFAVEQVLRPGGHLVLNAEDPRVLARGQRVQATPFWYALDANHPQILACADAGGETAFVEDGTLFFLRGHLHEALISETRLPITSEGPGRANTSRALAAAALAVSMGLSVDAIAAGLEHFQATPGSPVRGSGR